MSQENAVAFMSKVRDDVTLQNELRTLAPTDFDGLLKVAQARGFGTFSKDDYYHGAETVGGEWILWALKLAGKPLPKGLSDADLEQVAGGKGSAGVPLTSAGCVAF